MDFEADLDLFYADADTVTRGAGMGAPFLGFLDSAGVRPFDGPFANTHVLQYRSTVRLAQGELLTIRGRAYKVIAPPQLNEGDATELLAPLVAL
ncbi:MAG: hypothetical protein Q7J47_03335 [Azoarcus sp.]|nr:hypothetical protein [Azoarcus sp.]